MPDLKGQDGLTPFAWCLMGNCHYLALKSVIAGLVGDLEEYRWSGHGEMSSEDLRRRGKGMIIGRARERRALLGIERYGLRAKDVARAIKKSPGGISRGIARAADVHRENAEGTAEVDVLDKAIEARR